MKVPWWRIMKSFVRLINKILYTILLETGNQWRDFRIGEMLSDLLRMVTRRAAIFWIRWRREIWFLGRPIYSELHISKRQVTKEWTICSVACWVKYFLILQILWMWDDAELTTFDIYDFINIPESKTTPRLRTWLTRFTSELPTMILSEENLLKCLVEPISMYSVLFSFSFKKLLLIHWLTDFKHASNFVIPISTFCWDGFNLKYNCVSSA